MFDILCVTNRTLCEEDFLDRIEKIAKEKPSAIILREKDLTAEDYKKLAAEVLAICEANGVLCILHNFVEVATDLGVRNIHLPLHKLRELVEAERKNFDMIGASCHSLEDALEAVKLGCSYILAGHIFETDCKKGLEGRGLSFLKEICAEVSIPVYAIGGINEDNISNVINNGASGACIMSGFMTAANPKEYMQKLKKEIGHDI